MGAAERIEDRKRQVLQDLAELADQVAVGEVEAGTAQRLRGLYERELVEIGRALSAIDGPDASQHDAPEDDVAPLGSLRAVAVSGAVLLIVLTGLIVWAGGGLGSDSSDDDGASTAPTGAAGSINVDSMSIEELEQSLADFPDSAVVRLALADRYLVAGDQLVALEHYLVVASGDAAPEARSRAMARVGYLSYVTGQHESARETLLESISFDPGNTEAMLYLGYVFWEGLGDEAAAIPYFESVIADPSMPPEVVAAVSDLLAAARRGDG